MRSVIKPSAKIFIITLRAGVSASDAVIEKNILVSSTNTLIISNKEMENITEIVKSLK